MWLSKTRALLHRRAEYPSPIFYPLHNEGDGARLHHLQLDPIIWDEMGNPDTVTVTVEAGDTMNASPEYGSGGEAPPVPAGWRVHAESSKEATRPAEEDPK